MPKIIEPFESTNTTLEICIQDNQKAHWLLLVHGFNDTKETFIFLEPFLSQHFNLISFDHRGHGGSLWNQNGIYHYSELLLDLHTIIEKYLKAPFSVLGHSLGAGLLARYSGVFPEKVKSMILLEGFGGISPWEKERQRIQSWLEANTTRKQNKSKRRILTRKDAVNKLSLIYNSLEASKIESLVDGLIQPFESGFVWKNDPRIKNMTPLPFPPELSRHLWSQIRAPILLFFGEKTHLRPSNLEEIKTHFQNLKYFEVPKAGHNMHHDNPDFLVERISDYLELIK
jgi:pimeloyl-ACP methyl ester carboxylesterase